MNENNQNGSNGSNSNNSKKEKKYTVTKGSLILRIVVSVYLLYTVYQLSGSVGTAVGTDKIVVIVAMVVFTIIAVPLGGLSLKAMSHGEYAQPATDTEEVSAEDEQTEEIPEVEAVDIHEEDREDHDTVK